MTSGFGNSSEWHSSSWCEGGACIEAAAQDDAILLRSSADPDGSIFAFTRAAWQDLTARIKAMTVPNALYKLPSHTEPRADESAVPTPSYLRQNGQGREGTPR